MAISTFSLPHDSLDNTGIKNNTHAHPPRPTVLRVGKKLPVNVEEQFVVLSAVYPWPPPFVILSEALRSRRIWRDERDTDYQILHSVQNDRESKEKTERLVATSQTHTALPENSPKTL